MLIIGFRRWKQKDSEFKASWGSIVRPCVKKPKQINKHTASKQSRFIILLWLAKV